MSKVGNRIGAIKLSAVFSLEEGQHNVAKNGVGRKRS